MDIKSIKQIEKELDDLGKDDFEGKYSDLIEEFKDKTGSKSLIRSGKFTKAFISYVEDNCISGKGDIDLDDIDVDDADLEDLDLDLDKDEDDIDLDDEEFGEELDAFDLEDLPDEDETGGEITEDDIFEEEIELERTYVVPLARAYRKAPRWKRAKKASIYLREFVTKHMKPEGDVYIAQELNERIWENGMQKPPRKIRIRSFPSVKGV